MCRPRRCNIGEDYGRLLITTASTKIVHLREPLSGASTCDASQKWAMFIKDQRTKVTSPILGASNASTIQLSISRSEAMTSKSS